MTIDYTLDWCWGSTDRQHRFWLRLHGDVRLCINCRARQREGAA